MELKWGQTLKGHMNLTDDGINFLNNVTTTVLLLWLSSDDGVNMHKLKQKYLCYNLILWTALHKNEK